MQKSASPASVALRLNNLEQRFDELEAPEPSEPDRTILDKLAENTIFGAETPGAMNPDWTKNQYWFEGGKSLAVSLYGYGQFSWAYPAVLESPFYTRVFGSSDLWGRPSTNAEGSTVSLSYSIYGSANLGLFDEYFAKNERGDDSLCHRIFGEINNVLWLKDQFFTSSFFEKVFNYAGYAQADIDYMDRGDTLIDIIRSQHDDIERLKDDIASLSARLGAIGG